MCGRYSLNEDPARLAGVFDLEFPVEFAPSWNIAPSQRIVAISADEAGRRHGHTWRWGLIPSWAKDPAIANKLINARGETAAEKPSFRNAFKYRRCLIPASGFYEWQAEGRLRQPWYISLRSGEPAAFAGLWERWRSPQGDELDTCCILTTNANALMARLHERMPVILAGADWTAWLDPGVHEARMLQPLLAPCPAAALRAWPVGGEVGKAGWRDDAALIAPTGPELSAE